MKIKFWGVRGSIPVPGPTTQKIGGNTSCIEIEGRNNILIFDAGTGIKALGDELIANKNKKHIHILLTHYHLDHMMGLPFFAPLHDKSQKITIYGPKKKGVSLLKALNHLFSGSETFFPVKFAKLSAQINLVDITQESITYGGRCIIEAHAVNHPGLSLAYTVKNMGRKIVYLPDHEMIHKFNHMGKNNKGYTEELIGNLKNCDLLIHDSQYNEKDYPHYCGWGHSSWDHAIAFAHVINCKRLVLFHHNPNYSDNFLMNAEKKIIKREKPFPVSLAREGQIIKL